MKAIIPVAGEGTRLRPHTHTTPKVLVHVAGKPILGHILEKLTAVGVDEIVLIVGYRGQQVTDYVTREFDLKVHVVRQEKLHGLGHAIYLAREYFNGGPGLIVLGDTIFECSFENVLKGGFCSIGVKEVDDPRRFGVVEVEGGWIKNLMEKPDPPPSNLAIVGLYYIEDTLILKKALEKLILEQDRRTKGEYQLTDALEIMLRQGVKMTTFPVEGWYDCGKPETLLLTNRALLEKKSQSRPHEGSIIREPVHIADNVTLVDSIIGPYVSIAEGAHIEQSIIEDSIINRNSVVKKATLKGSLLGDSSLVEGAFQSLNVGDSAQIRFGETTG
ncbi:MAG: NTP transferase domain-containing protein [Candidatus Omnitrophica bacterium]|nr:NTP transferase domain-containing protein [bacterium]MBK7494145.1 NTP transferase domain-containing protein [Candidatus Omnitrophota bacterium]